MAKVRLRPGAMLAPLPTALVTCTDGERDNILTVSWTGILSTVPPRTYIAVRPRRFSHGLLLRGGDFVVHPCPASLVRAMDFCGMYTGAKVDKFERCHLTRVPSEVVAAPTIEECPVALECRVTEVRQWGSHDVFFADILSVSADETLFDERGALHFERAEFCSLCHGAYYAPGRRLGSFGFSAAGSRKKPRRRSRDGTK